MTPTIITDSREQNKELIHATIKKHGGIASMITCLPHGCDYMILGAADSAGVQRKSGSTEIPKQMQDLTDDILPALKELTDNPILLIEEDFVIGHNGIFYRRHEGMLVPTDLNVKAYFNFIHSVKMSGVDVVTTRNLDASIWWLIATAMYLEHHHYPKRKKKYGAPNQAIGVLCCINGVGQTKAEKILQEHTLKELFAMEPKALTKIFTPAQVKSFESVRASKWQTK